MEFSIRIVIVAILALAAALFIVMTVSGMFGQGGEAFSNVVNWLGGSIK